MDHPMMMGRMTSSLNCIAFSPNSTTHSDWGHFNLVRFQHDKSNGNIDHWWSEKFNAWVEIWSLLEIRMSGRKFTWANNQENNIMTTIDRIFCTTELEAIFPLCTSQALPRTGSDHTPLLWDSGVDTVPRVSSFKFEKWWLLIDNLESWLLKMELSCQMYLPSGHLAGED